MGDARRETFCQMQEHFRLYRRGQRLALIVNLDLKAARLSTVAQFRLIASVDKYQPHGVHIQRQGITLRRSDLRQTGNKLTVEQAVQRRVFPVLMLARRQAETQHLLQVLLRLFGSRFALGFKQAMPLLQRVTAVR
ncbi:hypothetical protein D3C85_1478400 [compost metagenome]